MPELPEVESFARYVSRHALRRSIQRVDVRDERIVGTRPDVLRRSLRGRAFRRVRRHGKHLFAEAGGVWVHVHFGMSGEFFWYREPQAAPRFARLVFDFSDGSHLAFDDMRLFGVVELTESPEAYIAEHGLGPDPLGSDFGLAAFRRLVTGRRGAVKSLLMSQDVIAGIGNLYADESLFQSGIHPRAPVDALGNERVARLHRAVRRILREAVTRRVSGRELPSRWLFQHRTEGTRCPACGGTIARTVVFGRTTYYCAKHQPLR